jgi:predicted component of type VI protein secretion system
VLSPERALDLLRDAYGAGHLSTATLEARAEWDLPKWWHRAQPRPSTLGDFAIGERGRWVLGRSRSCDLRLEDGSISRRHAELAVRANVCLVRDLGSTNGTYVNDRRVRVARLRRGDVLTLGETQLRAR